MSEQQEEVEVKTPAGTFRARGYDLIMILIVVVCSVQATLLYQHLEDAKATGAAVAATNKEVSRSINELVREQRLTTCIFVTKEEQREREYMQSTSFCNRVSK